MDEPIQSSGPPKPPDEPTRMQSGSQKSKSKLGKMLREACFKDNPAGITVKSNNTDSGAVPKESLHIIEDLCISDPAIHKVQLQPKEIAPINNIMDCEDLSSSDEGAFRVVTGKRARSGDYKVLPTKLNSKPVADNDANRFSILGELHFSKESCQTTAPNNNSVNRDTPVRENGGIFCPPIFLYNMNISHLISQLKDKNITYKIVNKSKFKSKLYVKDALVHSEMMSLLRKNDIESYSYTPKELRKTSFVLRGLYHNTELDLIKEEIDRVVPNTVETVSKFVTNYSRKNKIDTGLFLVTLLSGRTHREIISTKYILNQKITWESPKANSKAVQCFRCQQWGHLSRNCNRKFACVKCDDSHGPGECKLEVRSDSVPYCVNCKLEGHTSNYRGCPAYKKYVDNRKSLMNKFREKRQRASDNVLKTLGQSVVPGTSFADVLRNGAASQSSSKVVKPQIVQDFLRIAQMLCQTMTLEKRIENFMRNYGKLSTEEAKQQCLCLMDEVARQYGP